MTYKAAAVCRRGHPQTGDLTKHGPSSSRCAECGATVLTSCPSCDARIRGVFESQYSIQIAPYEPPPFCDNCGSPFPWADRQARIHQLENVLDEQELDEATRLVIMENLEVLRQPDVPEDEQRERWGRIKRLAPGFIDSGRNIVESVVSAAIRAHLGI